MYLAFTSFLYSTLCFCFVLFCLFFFYCFSGVEDGLLEGNMNGAKMAIKHKKKTAHAFLGNDLQRISPLFFDDILSTHILLLVKMPLKWRRYPLNNICYMEINACVCVCVCVCMCVYARVRV